MREIKFRAWSTAKKHKMIYLNQFTSVDLLEAKDWKIMQYTGLKDKKGNEIYEGDILEQRDWNRYERGVVEYRLSSFKIIWGDYCNHSLILHNNAPNSKVIGNIYEKPELLKGYVQ